MTHRIVIVFPTLLAAHLRSVQAVEYAKHDRVFAVLGILGDIRGKTAVRPDVFSRELAVHEQFGYVIDAFEMQENAFARFLFDGYFSAVRNVTVVGELAYAARLVLGRERHVYRPVRLENILDSVAESEPPYAVQALPIFAHELRARIVFYIALRVLHSRSFGK